MTLFDLLFSNDINMESFQKSFQQFFIIAFLIILIGTIAIAFIIIVELEEDGMIIKETLKPAYRYLYEELINIYGSISKCCEINNLEYHRIYKYFERNRMPFKDYVSLCELCNIKVYVKKELEICYHMLDNKSC